MALNNPVDRKSIEDALRDWLERSTGLKWIRANQTADAPRPPLPYGTYDLRVAARQGADDEQRLLPHVDGADVVTVQAAGLRRATLSCNVWARSSDPRGDADAYCDRAVAALSLDSYRDPLVEKNIGLISVSDIRDLSVLENKQAVSRSQFDVFLNVVSVALEDVGFFDTIEVSAFVEDNDPLWPNPQTFNTDTE